MLSVIHKIRAYHSWACFLLGLALFAHSAQADPNANEGGDLVIGGPGSEAGKFLEMRDLTVDAQGNVYALDGAHFDDKTKKRIGNLRVQKFSSEGKLLGITDLSDEATGEKLGAKNDPQRLAVDAHGNVYVTQPAAGLVQQFAANGKFVRSIKVPNAMAITICGQKATESIAVVASRRAVVPQKGWTWLGGDRILILTDKGNIERTIRLQVAKTLEHVLDITADRQGNFYVQAEPAAIYKFSTHGKLLKTYGGNTHKGRHPSVGSDGSEVLHTVAVDSKGNVYTFTWGNPGIVTRFDADGKTITQRDGQFQWADAWGPHGQYTPLAIGPDDRLWVAATGVSELKKPNPQGHRAVPVVLRVKKDFFEKQGNRVHRKPIFTLGYRPNLTCSLPYNVSYTPGKSVSMEYVVEPAVRYIPSVNITWQAFDVHKKEIARGESRLALQNGKEARYRFEFTPPRFGSYFVLLRAKSEQGDLGGLGAHIGVAPVWPGMPELKERESKGSGWDDVPRQMWTGLPTVRLHPDKGMEQFETALRAAEKYGATVLVQLVDNQKHLKADKVRDLMKRFKGRIHYVEVCNEPNFTGSIESYFDIHKTAYEVIKSIDPQVKVMGPATVNMDLHWLKRLYELGFKDVSDVISLHDYEGNESVSPGHWRWKFAEVRKLMAANGDSAKPIWQTERAIMGVRSNFQGLVQAIRTTMHRDLLETLGVPAEHDIYYYLNQAGYSTVPSYLWSHNGPHPGALALRTRHALTAAKGRTYAGKLDFGSNGDDLFLGVRYAGKDGETISLRNLGTRETPLDFGVKGTSKLEIVDAWGNTSQAIVTNGKVSLTLDQLPVYVLLPKGAKLTASRLDFGTNLAKAAHFSYSAKFKEDISQLNNGIMEMYHHGSPHTKLWQGDMPSKPGEQAPILEITFEQPQQIGCIVVRGVRADNIYCAPLAYDLQYQQGAEWKTIEQIKRPMPPSEANVRTADAMGAVWMDDTNYFLHRFTPMKTTRLRLVAHNMTHGFIPDASLRPWGGGIIAQKLMLREIEVYGPEKK